MAYPVKRAWTQNRQVGRSQDAAILGMLASNLQNDRTMAFHSELEANVEALTTNDVRAAMRRNLDLEALTIIKAGDFE